MPLTPEMRRSIDQIRDYLFGGGYPDPVSNAEQLSFLFFFYLVAGIDAENALKAKVMKQPYESLFAGEWTLKNPLNASVRPERSAESHPVRPERSTASHPNHPERSTAPHSVRPERSAEGAESKGLTIPPTASAGPSGPRACPARRWCASCATRSFHSLPNWASRPPTTSCTAPVSPSTSPPC